MRYPVRAPGVVHQNTSPFLKDNDGEKGQPIFAQTEVFATQASRMRMHQPSPGQSNGIVFYLYTRKTLPTKRPYHIGVVVVALVPVRGLKVVEAVRDNRHIHDVNRMPSLCQDQVWAFRVGIRYRDGLFNKNFPPLFACCMGHKAL